VAKSCHKGGAFRSARFLYEDVKRELRRRIDEGAYPPGSRIPSASKLTREFEVSGITIRRALHDLTLAGLLRGRQGLGVFVAHAPRIERSLGVDFRTSIGDEIRRAGAVPGVREISLSLVAPEPRVAQALGLPRRSLVYRLEKLILADNEPTAFDTTYLPRPLGETLKNDLDKEFVFPLLVARGLMPEHIDFRIEASTVSETQALAFGLPIGFPVLVVDYTPMRRDGTAILTGRSVSRSDRFVYAFCPNPRLHGDGRGG
jgi:GntR family transcriptional regulator